MRLLNIFQHSDGSFAWETILLFFVFGVAGYLLHRYFAKKSLDDKYAADIAEHESRYKKLDNEYKNYKSNISTSEKQNEKAVVQMSGRVKALEGDIRVLSEEKNKLYHQSLVKEEEIKRYSRQVTDMEDNLKAFKESRMKTDAEWAEKLKLAKEELAKALVWEQRVRSAEEEAQRARSAIGNAERKKLEAELRLKATTEYAGKVLPLENELKMLKEKYEAIEAEVNSKRASTSDLESKLGNAETQLKAKEEELAKSKNELTAKNQSIADSEGKTVAFEEISSQLKITKAQLELLRDNNSTLQQEFEMKHATNVSLMNEIEHTRAELRKLAEENEMLRSKAQATESLL